MARGEKIAVAPVVASRHTEIPADLLHPSTADSRFLGGLPVTLYIAEGITLQAMGGQMRSPDAYYLTDDQLYKMFTPDSIETSEQEAERTVGNRNTAAFFECVLSMLHGKPITLQHLTVELFGFEGIPIHTYGITFQRPQTEPNTTNQYL